MDASSYGLNFLSDILQIILWYVNYTSYWIFTFCPLFMSLIFPQIFVERTFLIPELKHRWGKSCSTRHYSRFEVFLSKNCMHLFSKSYFFAFMFKYDHKLITIHSPKAYFGSVVFGWKPWYNLGGSVNALTFVTVFCFTNMFLIWSLHRCCTKNCAFCDVAKLWNAICLHYEKSFKKSTWMRVHLRKLIEIHKNMQNTNLCRVRIEFCTLLYDLPSKLKSKMFVSFYVVFAFWK